MLFLRIARAKDASRWDIRHSYACSFRRSGDDSSRFRNARKSTGPRTDAGKAVSSRNHLTLGLFTRKDYVTWEEQDLYDEFCGAMRLELSPDGLLEEALATEVTAATWRLRRCSNAEYEIGSSEDEMARPYRHNN